jgi:uncharacterized protein (TIGR02996 family)
MTDREALLQSILNNPDDDSPRLVFADWLEEHGEPERAEFIRVQFESERYPIESKRWRILDRRASELLEQHRKPWNRLPKKLVNRVVFRRGFVDKVTMPVERFVESGRKLFEVEPVRALRPSQAETGAYEDLLGRLAQSKLLAQLAALDFGNWGLRDEHLAILARSRFLNGLKQLDIDSSYDHLSSEKNITGAGLCSFLSSAKVAALHLLVLNGVTFRQNDVQSVMVHRAIRDSVRELHFLHCHFDANEPLACLPRITLPELRVLSLSLSIDQRFDNNHRCRLTDMLQSSNLRRLELLSLNGFTISSECIQALANSPWASQLRLLRLANCGLDDQGARLLIESKNLSSIVRLDLSGNRIGTELASELRKRFKQATCTFAW